MPERVKKYRFVFAIYWFLLIYIIAALIWWFIALTQQNREMAQLKKKDLIHSNQIDPAQFSNINEQQKRKTAQYIGEGSFFLLMILGGAIFVFRAVRTQLKQSLEQQNFMIAITHELKTPIAVAKLNLETLQKRKLDDLQQQRLIQNTLQEANRLNSLCSNMLLSSQIEAGGYRITSEELNWSDIVSTAIEEFMDRYPQRLFEHKVEPNLFITGDELLLRICVNNLLENAVKYSPKEKPVSISLKKQGAQAELLVADLGPGIGSEERHKVFKKFYRIGNEATKKAKGTGLGLYLTSRIIKTHGGTIHITDNPAGGSIFVLRIPAEA